jgi:hypothetical protein
MDDPAAGTAPGRNSVAGEAVAAIGDRTSKFVECSAVVRQLIEPFHPQVGALKQSVQCAVYGPGPDPGSLTEREKVCPSDILPVAPVHPKGHGGIAVRVGTRQIVRRCHAPFPVREMSDGEVLPALGA